MTTPQTDWLATFRQTFTKALVYLLCSLTAMPAWSADSTSTLYQAPPFTSTEPPANVFMMLDDSGSMARHDLPTPVGITIDRTTVATKVAIRGEGADSTGNWAERSWEIDRDHDWVLRAPALNPLWYNPATRYVPWNKDGTLMANASIGGSAATTNYGAFTARANQSQLTERDPRQVPVGPNFSSITNAAGRGLVGTDPSSQQNAIGLTSRAYGRNVRFDSHADFRYHKLPFDFGPILPGATTAPRNGHADRAWTTHNATTSPLDLFSRPLQVATTTSVSGCFANAASCLAGNSALASIVTTTWKRTNCSNVEETFTTEPASLTCYSRPNCSNVIEYFSANPGPLVCGYTWTDCYGVRKSQTTDPGTITCPIRRQNCDNTWTDYATSPGALTCYRTRGCDGSAFGTWSATNPGTPTACYSRTNCSNTTEYFSGTDPGQLACNWSQTDCAGNTSTFATRPPNLTCYKQKDCSGTDRIYSTPPSPATLLCKYSRKNCGASTATNYFPPAPDPGPLTCYTRQNCNGSTTGPTATVLGPLTCPTSAEQPTIYQPSTSTNASSKTEYPTENLVRAATGGGTQNSSVHPRLGTKSIGVLTPGTITATASTKTVTTLIRAPSSLTGSSCPAGTSQRSCIIPALPGSPDPLALTPARYYSYTGTGDRGAPGSYKVVQIDRTRPAAVFTVIDATTGVAATEATSQRSDCAAKTSCTWLEEAQNYANWYLYYRNRLFAAQAVLADSLSSLTSNSQQKLRIGYGRINYYAGSYNPWKTEQGTLISTLPSIDGETNPGALVRGVRPFIVGTPERAAFFDWLFSVSWQSSTPNREAVDSVGRYFARTDTKGPWGAKPGVDDDTPQLACRRNSLFLTTDGEWTYAGANQTVMSESGPASMTAPGGPIESDNVAAPTITGNGPNAGATFTYLPANWLQFTGGVGQSKTLTDAAVYYWNHDLRPDMPNVILPVTDSLRPNPAFWQSMSTYIIGYGLSASMDTAATRAAVSSGATVLWPAMNLGDGDPNNDLNRVNDSLRAALASRGNFYAAQTVAELKSGVLSSFLELATRQGSAGGVAITSPAITSTSQAFFPSYTTGKWTGSLKAYTSRDLESLAQGNVVTPEWTASLPAFGTRNILSSTALKSPTVFNVASLNATQAIDLTSTTAGFSYTAAEAVSYLRGDNRLELPATGIAAGTKFRRRESLLGDIVNSTPLYVKAPDYGYSAMSTVGATYSSYVRARRDSTVSTVYVGANDGMFHAFDAATGIERFAYVPRGVYPTLANLLNPGYEHNYYVDGPVTAGDWHDGSAWRSMVIGTTGAGGANGGSSVFAIDITNPATITASNVKWDYTPADSDHLGHILSRGIVGRIKTSTGGTQWVYMVGNGYESRRNKAALLVFNIATGEMTSIPVGPTWTIVQGEAKRNGMGGITVVHDNERNIRLVYGGDRQGNLWRFDFSSGTPDVAKGFDGTNTPLFTAVDGSVPRPISAAPRLVPHPLGGMLVIFGTGKLHDTTDGVDTASQGIYAIWDKPQYTGVRIPSAKIKSLTVTGAAGSSRTIDTAVDWNSFMGWSAELTGGERIISDPTADVGSLTVTSYAPSAALDPCNGGGMSYIYRFNFATGIITGTQVNGVIGAVTPLTIEPTSTNRTATSGVNISSGISRTTGNPPGTPVPLPGGGPQCRLYSTSIQARPNVIAVNCPNFAPMRVWRQQVR